jgi:hypothetical protein
MLYQGVRIFADESGVCFGKIGNELYGFQGEIVYPMCCIDVSVDDGREISSAVQVGTPFGGQMTNNTICGAELAMCLRGNGLVLGLGYRAVKVKGSLVCTTPKRN